MKTHDSLPALTLTWLALVALTLLSLGLGEWFRAANWLPVLVAAIVWLKGELVARYFLESRSTHPFIARLLKVFIVIAPVALILTAFFGAKFSRWATI
jgi:hypothetical protein